MKSKFKPGDIIRHIYSQNHVGVIITIGKKSTDEASVFWIKRKEYWKNHSTGYINENYELIEELKPEGYR